MLEALTSIAVFSENATMFDHAVAFWRQRTKSYFYLSSADGDAQPPFPPGRQGGSTWYNQTVFNASVDGVCQETCRDFGHMQMGFAACVNAAATAFTQGVDLFAEQAPRLAAATEFAARFLQGAPVPAYVCSGHALTLSLVATFEVAFDALNGRLGVQLPAGWAQITSRVRPSAAPDGIVSVFESLTHGAAAPR